MVTLCFNSKLHTSLCPGNRNKFSLVSSIESEFLGNVLYPGVEKEWAKVRDPASTGPSLPSQMALKIQRRHFFKKIQPLSEVYLFDI